MMARFPAPMAGWSVIVPTVVDTIVKALVAGDARPGAGRPSWPARRRGGVLRHASQDQAPLRGAEHRGRRLGRPAVRGRRVRHRLGLPGRRAQRLDRGHRAEMPGGGGEPRAAAGFLRRRQIPRRARHRHAGAQPGRGPLEFRAGAAAATARPGASGAAPPASPAAICCGCRARTSSSRWSAPISRCRSTPRRSCAPAAAAAGAIRWSAIRRWSRTDVREELVSRRGGARALRRGARGTI